MSRTSKDRAGKRPVSVRGKKLKPYVGANGAGKPKYVASPGRGLGTSGLGMLIARNANRSRKKAARREAKLSIATELRSYND